LLANGAAPNVAMLVLLWLVEHLLYHVGEWVGHGGFATLAQSGGEVSGVGVPRAFPSCFSQDENRGEAAKMPIPVRSRVVTFAHLADGHAGMGQ
jgi:hypothetical protein